MTQDLYTGGKVLAITRWGETVMHRETEKITNFNAELHQLIRDMFATMAAAEGVGLAATQVGVGIALFVYNCPDANNIYQKGIVCNPEVILPEGKDRVLDTCAEGCLSLPGAYAELSRPDQAICRGQDENGDPIEIHGTGLLARCLQHETDHLNGMVFGDRLSARARKNLYKEHEKLAIRYPSDWPIQAKLTD